MGKKKEYDPKVPGQQYEEIEAQKRKNHEAIGSIQKSKDRDQEELEQLAEEALKKRICRQATPQIGESDKLED